MQFKTFFTYFTRFFYGNSIIKPINIPNNLQGQILAFKYNGNKKSQQAIEPDL